MEFRLFSCWKKETKSNEIHKPFLLTQIHKEYLHQLQSMLVHQSIVQHHLQQTVCHLDKTFALIAND